MLNRLYSHDDETKALIDTITGGAEKPIVNIPRKEKLHRGAADQLYNKVIIEFENDLSRTLAHAKEQLAGYLLGQYRSGEGYNYVLIASDLTNWKVFSIDVSQLDRLSELREDELNLIENLQSSFTLKDGKEDDFYFWLDRFLFRNEKQKAKLATIAESFGSQSLVFREAYVELQKYFQKVKDTGEIEVAYDQWKKTLSIAYDVFNDSADNFLIHTYLSVFAKMLAYEVISNDPYIEDEEVRGIIDGTIFHNLNIENFVEDDFFAWIKSEAARRELRSIFRAIAQELSLFDFSDVDEDILKGVYQELIDLDTRKRLGEYYTPDWLCERIVQEFDFKQTDKILDPACGSGSFLRAVIDKLKRDFPNAEIESINRQVHGIDIHPLSVQIAKTTVLLALGHAVRSARFPIHLNVILANTLLTPKGIQDMYGSELEMKIDKERLFLNAAIFDDARLFDTAVEVADELAKQTRGTAKSTIASFRKAIENRGQFCLVDDAIVSDYYRIYESFKTAKENDRDSIWKFIVQNLYKPYFMAGKFDYVIGNPPWFTYSSIRNESYQNTLDALARAYAVKPERAANYPHLEIAAIFLAYCSSFFLKEHGHIAFVLPRAFMSADHHDNTRRGIAEGVSLTKVWDLNDVAPLFRVPTCVLFAEKPSIWPGRKSDYVEAKEKNLRRYSGTGIPGTSFSGSLSVHNGNLHNAGPLLTERATTWFYIRQGGSSALSERRGGIEQRENPYKNLFKQGATIVPRTFYFVELNQEDPPDFRDRIVNIKSATEILCEAKAPWKNFTFDGRIESRFLFRTALSKSILPFALYKPNLIALPATIKLDEFGRKNIKLHSAKDLRDEGYLKAARWFAETERVWEDNRTERNESNTAVQYLNWQNKVTEQNLNENYLVLYNSSAVNANATIVKRDEIDLEFVVESKAYAFSTSIPNEAFYLAAILNSAAPNEMMKDFQTRGLFGPRDIHRKILDIYYPRFDASNKVHLELARLSETAHARASEFLALDPHRQNLTPRLLGRLRLEIKKHVKDELSGIDALVEKLIKPAA